MEISPKYSTEDWNALDLSNPSERQDQWEEAVKIFEDRIRRRFLDVVENIQSMPFSGFVVMAIDSLLIETLEQFYQGVPDSNKGSRSVFDSFFKRNQVLNSEFTKDQRELFFRHFRCGILHQAEIKGDSLVWKVGPLVWDKGNNGIVVNRDQLHEILVDEFIQYIQKLCAQNPIDTDLRLKFQAKMDYICRKPQYYFAFRPSITNQDVQMKLGQVDIIGQAILHGWRVKKNKNKTFIGVEPDVQSQVPGTIYRISVEQLDKLTDNLERDNKPLPVQVACPIVSQFQTVWVYSR